MPAEPPGAARRKGRHDARGAGRARADRYAVELRLTNRSQDSLLLEHVYSSLALPSKWSEIEVRQLNPDCSVAYPLVQDGDLLGATGPSGAVCLGSCQTLELVLCLVGRCEFQCAESSAPTPRPVLGGVGCTLLQDHLLICASQPCDPPPYTAPHKIRKRHEVTLPT